MKGQLTLEFLFLSLISVSFLILSIYSLGSLKSTSNDMIGQASFEKDASTLFTALSTVCAGGSLSRQTVYLSAPISLVSSSTDRIVSLRLKSDQSVRQTRELACAISPDSLDLNSGKVIVENEAGVVSISQ
ncbi:hypothetical protein HY990_02855 [Candidatus Micrarchaeota archaeon]|nr:hypothetical protein [Candidatus Micrarchaeota archaeon]